MELATKDRVTLKSYFEHNDIPTEGQFQELIDGMLNQREDGIARHDGVLSVWPLGGPTTRQPVLKIYPGLQDNQAEWVLSLNPRADPADAASARRGLSVGTAAGESRLFVDQETGNLGVGTVGPKAKLHIIGPSDVKPSGGGLLVLGDVVDMNVAFDNNEIMARKNGEPSTLSLQAEGGEIHVHTLLKDQPTNRLVFKGNGNLGLGTVGPQAKLHIVGGADVTLEGGGSLVMGKVTSLNLALDENEIQARNNKQPAPLHLQNLGGIVAAGGVVKANGGLQFDRSRADHLEVDGALYRHGNQVYLTVDDHFYIRDLGGAARFHFQTDKGVIEQEGWHAVNKADFQNGWTNYGGDWNRAAYFRDSLGIVHLRGLIKSGVVDPNTGFFTLPEGFRPPGNELRMVENCGYSTRVDVLKSGQVRAYNPNNNRWISLDGISFRAA